MIKVLMVEDSDEDADVIQDTLSRELPKLSVSRVTSSDEALILLKANRYDCVLLDLELPGLGGLEFLELLRDSRTMAPPIVVVTGRGDEAKAVRAMQYGAKDYVSKRNLRDSCLAMVIQNVIGDFESLELEKVAQSKVKFDEATETARDSLSRVSASLRKSASVS